MPFLISKVNIFFHYNLFLIKRNPNLRLSRCTVLLLGTYIYVASSIPGSAFHHSVDYFAFFPDVKSVK